MRHSMRVMGENPQKPITRRKLGCGILQTMRNRLALIFEFERHVIGPENEAFASAYQITGKIRSKSKCSALKVEC